MSDAIYTMAVLRLAAEANAAGRLVTPDVSYTEHNPACGDRSTIDLQLQGGRITAVAQDTRACVFAQASASILGQSIAGRTRADLLKLREDVVRMLQQGLPPAEPFGRYETLKAVAAIPGRHKCVLLPIDAALKAFEALDAAEPGGERPKT
ncbi:MAG: iron-sulfur cluster assembly scaffold protein [Alphaproteobacteria bacterium]|nr:iron-sulfur cluster assembly scaffold protein [Alphaproteobacteria bacterium]